MDRLTETGFVRPDDRSDALGPSFTGAESAASTTFSSEGPFPVPATGEASSGPGHSASEPGHSASDRAYEPARRGPEIEPTRKAMGGHVAGHMVRANWEMGRLHSGVHYFNDYYALCVANSQPELCKDEYRRGHSRAPQFIQPHELGRFMDWELKKGESASQGIKAWLAGATIAECLSSLVVMEIDALRAAIGDAKFDRMFGSADATEDAAIPEERRLRIGSGSEGTPVAKYLRSTTIAKEAIANGGPAGKVSEARLDEDLAEGQWYYFSNHPKYSLKHPAGSFVGENALYMGKNFAGKRMWAGLGVMTRTEKEMVAAMAAAYNRPRDGHDLVELKRAGVLSADGTLSSGTYSREIYDPASGEFPDQIDAKEVVDAKPYTLDGVQRTGGLVVSKGRELDPKLVKETRDAD